MKIFDKRPLSILLCVMLGGFVFSSIFDKILDTAILILAIILAIVALVLGCLKNRKSILVFLSSASLIFSFLFSYFYFDCYFADTRWISEDEVEICGRIREEREYDGFYTFVLECESISGEDANGLRVSFLYDFSDEEKTFDIGDSIKTVGIVHNVENTETFDSKTYNYTRGVSFEVTDVSAVSLIERGDPDIVERVSAYRSILTQRLIDASDVTYGGFAAALLLGDRSYVAPEINLSFMRTGLTHTLALSGMHLAILTGAISRLLAKIGISKKKRTLANIFFIVFYVSLTGFPVSVVRAGIMLLISSLLFLLSSTSDPITNLFISVTLICFITPYAIYDVSLWLSMLATLGVLVYNEIRCKVKEDIKSPSKWQRFVSAFGVTFMASVFAISFVMIITSVNFGTHSVISVFMTPLFAIFIEMYMNLACVALFFGNFLWIGSLLSYAGRLLITPIYKISTIDSILVSTDFAPVKILVAILSVYIITVLVIKLKNLKRVGLTLLMFLFAISISAYGMTAHSQRATITDYVCDDGGERIFYASPEANLVIDTSTPSRSNMYSAVDYITKNNIYSIDGYVFTVSSPKIAASVDVLLGSLLIDTIYIPSPRTESEREIMDELLIKTADYHTEIVFYSVNSPIELGEISYTLIYRNDNMRKFVFTLMINGKKLTYLSSGMLVGDTKTVALKAMSGSYALILGRHGNYYYDYEFIYKIEGLEYLVISSKNVFIYTETMKYYETTEIHFYPTKVDLIR